MNVNSFHLMCEKTGKTICHCEQYETANEIRDDFQRNAEILRMFEKRFPNTFVHENDMEIEYEVFPKVEMSISRKGGVPIQPIQQKPKQPVQHENKTLKKQTKKNLASNLQQKQVVIGANPQLPQNQPKQVIQQVVMNNKQHTNVVQQGNPQKEKIFEKHFLGQNLSPRICGFDFNIPPPPPPPPRVPPIIVPKNSNKIGINAGINLVVTQLQNNVNNINLPL